jgi:hypothetical protein
MIAAAARGGTTPHRFPMFFGRDARKDQKKMVGPEQKDTYSHEAAGDSESYKDAH